MSFRIEYKRSAVILLSTVLTVLCIIFAVKIPDEKNAAVDAFAPEGNAAYVRQNSTFEDAFNRIK